MAGLSLPALELCVGIMNSLGEFLMVGAGCPCEAAYRPRHTQCCLGSVHEQPGFPHSGFVPAVHTWGALELDGVGSTIVKFHTVASLFLSLVYGNIWRVFIYLILYSVITIVGLANIQQV